MSGPSDWIDLVIARANDLRRAGVLSIGPQSATFAPWSEPVETPKVDDKPKEESTPSLFDDPASYPDGQVPGFDLSELRGR